MARPNPRVDAAMSRKGYVSIPEASRRTGISRTTLYEALRDGTLPVKLVGKRRYIPLDRLLPYLGMTKREWRDAATAG